MASKLRLVTWTPRVLKLKLIEVKLVLASPNVPVGLIPRARSNDACWDATLEVWFNPVEEARFLKAPVVFAQLFIAAVGLVLVNASIDPSEFVVTCV
jgi:hypothetical protein